MHNIARITWSLFTALVVAAPVAGAQIPGMGFSEAPAEYVSRIPEAFSPFGGGLLPRSVDLSSLMPPPGNQGSQSSCVAWTVAYALRSYQARVREPTPLVSASGAIDSSRVFSPAFVYNLLNDGRNAGVYFGDALNLMQKVGVVPLAQMPYRDKDILTQPDSALVAQATQYRLQSWKRVDFRDIIEIKSHVNSGYPVMIGARLDDGFFRAGKDFVWRAPVGEVRGGHAMVIVGYDDDRHAVRILNSWGSGWGDGGYFWLDYDYLPVVVREAYIAKDVPAPPKRVITRLPPAPKIVASVTTNRLDTASVVVNVRPIAPPPVVVIPTLRPPAPSLLDASTVSIVRTRQDVTDSLHGKGLRFDGLVSIPGGTEGSLQVVVYFYLETAGKKGQFIQATTPRFSVGRERAATGTSPVAMSTTQTVNRAWVAFMPYTALDLRETAPGSVRIIAEPVVFIDRFGVKAGNQSHIACRCGR